MGSRQTAIEGTYTETETERQLVFEHEGHTAVVAQNLAGYAMLSVRYDGGELERYYGLDMALDHVAELFGVRPADLVVPDAGADLGM